MYGCCVTLSSGQLLSFPRWSALVAWVRVALRKLDIVAVDALGLIYGLPWRPVVCPRQLIREAYRID